MSSTPSLAWKPILLLSIVLLAGAVALSFPLFVWPKYTMTIYHFNPQYVAGDPVATANIINQSLYGLLKIYERHPSWKFTMEISGLGIEMMLENFTHVLNLLKKLVDRGQCELLVTHYSDQLWTAYPYEDLFRSIELSKRLLEKAGLRTAKIAMFQEGQWGPALTLLADEGYEATMVAEDIFYWFGHKPKHPILRWRFLGREILLVVFTEGIRRMNGITWVWRWIQDGELAVSYGYGNNFEYVESLARIHENRMKVFESQGWKFITVSEWIRIAEENGLVGELDKYLPESAWATFRCKGLYRWLGYHASEYEDDGYVRALNVNASAYVKAADLLHRKYSGLLNESERAEVEGLLDEAWKHLFLAEVSDSTGWNPKKVEVEYSIYHSLVAIDLAERVAEIYRKALGVRWIQVLLFDGTVIATNDSTKLVRMEYAGEAPQPVKLEGYVTSRISYVKYLGFVLYRIEVYGPGGEESRVSIHGDFSRITVSPALAENVTVMLNFSDYIRPFWLALPNGMVRAGNLTLIRDNRIRYIAWLWSGDSLSFVETKRSGMVRYVFYVAEGLSEEDALFLANAINVLPPVTFGGE